VTARQIGYPNLPLATGNSASTAGIALSDFGLISFQGEAPIKKSFFHLEYAVDRGVLLGVNRQSGGDKFR
jgi:hypothetical protein